MAGHCCVWLFPHTLAGQKQHFSYPFLRVAHGSPATTLSLCSLLSRGEGPGSMGTRGLGGKEEASQAIMGIPWLISSVYCSENEVTSPFAWQLIDEHFLSICRVDVLLHGPQCSWTPPGFSSWWAPAPSPSQAANVSVYAESSNHLPKTSETPGLEIVYSWAADTTLTTFTFCQNTRECRIIFYTDTVFV